MSMFSGVFAAYRSRAMQQRQASLSSMQTGAMVLSLIGPAMQSIGSFYSAEAERSQLKSAALSADYEATISSVNARQAESDAQFVLAEGQREVARAALRNAQLKGAQRASAGASGTQVGVGSSAETAASIELAFRADEIAIDSAAVRAANAHRGRAVDLTNRAAMARVTAENLRDSARSINPWIAAGTSLLAGAAPVASRWLYQTSTTGGY